MLRTLPLSLSPAALRTPSGPGRPYPAEVVASVRALVEGAGLSYREAAARSGLREDTIGRWARRFGWRRVGDTQADPSLKGRAESTRSVEPGWGSPGLGDTPPRSAGADSPSPEGEGSKRPYRYPPEVREAARLRVEGSRAGLERIADELGIARWTLHRWSRCFGWQRPAPPERGKRGPDFYRSRRLGRPYGGDAVGTARDLVTGSNLPLHRVAERAGISRATLYRWIERRGWTRHPAAAKGRRHQPPYPPEVVAAARELFQTTGLSPAFIAARVKATPERVGHWARTKGWGRPRDLPNPDGSLRRRRRRGL